MIATGYRQPGTTGYKSRCTRCFSRFFASQFFASQFFTVQRRLHGAAAIGRILYRNQKVGILLVPSVANLRRRQPLPFMPPMKGFVAFPASALVVPFERIGTKLWGGRFQGQQQFEPIGFMFESEESGIQFCGSHSTGVLDFFGSHLLEQQDQCQDRFAVECLQVRVHAPGDVPRFVSQPQLTPVMTHIEILGRVPPVS